MASLNDGASAGRLRVYEPAVQDDGAPPHNEKEQDRSLLLAKIHRHYDGVLHRLAVTSRPEILARFIDGGVCLGLLDPPSNIVANASAGGGWAEVRAGMDRRSLDGLVAFLTCFFPYLDDWEAVRYLLLADADPLLAALTSLLQDDGGRQLSSQDVWHLARLLCPKPPSISTPLQQQPVSGRRLHCIMADGKDQRRTLRRISRKVKAALRRYQNKNSNEPPCRPLATSSM